VRPLAPVVPSHTPEATSRSITPDCRGTCGAGRRCKPMETPECDGVRNGVSIIFYSSMENIIMEIMFSNSEMSVIWSHCEPTV